MQTLDLDKLRQEFNSGGGSVRLVAVFSPTCSVCVYGQGLVRRLAEEFQADKLKVLAVWLPMMRNDSLERANAEAAPFDDLPVVHVWDPRRQVGDLYTKTLGLQSTAWDFYFLYPPGVTWDGDEPPDPEFWMHQLPADSGADRDLVLYPSRFSQELLRLLGDGVEPSHTSRADLGLQLHWAGLLNMTRKRGEYTIEDVREAFEDSKTV